MLSLTILPDEFAVCRLGGSDAVPDWAVRGTFFSVTRTVDELSIVCPLRQTPAGLANRSAGWRALKIEGPFDFSETGILASVAMPLAAAGIGILAIATYDTDYVLVQADNLPRAVAALVAAGHAVRQQGE